MLTKFRHDDLEKKKKKKKKNAEEELKKTEEASSLQRMRAISEGAASEMHDTTGIAASIVVHFSNADRHPAAPVKVGHGDLLKGQVHGKRE